MGKLEEGGQMRLNARSENWQCQSTNSDKKREITHQSKPKDAFDL